MQFKKKSILDSVQLSTHLNPVTSNLLAIGHNMYYFVKFRGANNMLFY